MQTEAAHPDVYCPVTRCAAKPGDPCRSRDKEPHAERAERQKAVDHLRKLLPKGSTVYTVLRQVSASGMSRRIDLYTFKPGAEPGSEPVKLYLSGYVATSGQYRRHKHGAIVVGGCGMDMGYHLVSNLSYALHGYDNHKGEGSDKSGYTLRHEWI